MNNPPTAILPRKACAVVFDMDGPIFDTEALYMDAIRAVANDGGHDIPPSLLLATIGLSLEATRTVYLEHCGQDFDFDAFWLTVSQRFRELAETQLRLKAGVAELLDVLDAGLFAWRLNNVRPLDVDFPVPARLRIYTVDLIGR